MSLPVACLLFRVLQSAPHMCHFALVPICRATALRTLRLQLPPHLPCQTGSSASVCYTQASAAARS